MPELFNVEHNKCRADFLIFLTRSLRNRIALVTLKAFKTDGMTILVFIDVFCFCKFSVVSWQQSIFNQLYFQFLTIFSKWDSPIAMKLSGA